MTQPLSPGYSPEVDTLDSGAWQQQTAGFRDANLYQVWTGSNSSSVSRLLLKREGRVVAAAEVRLFVLPLTRHGIAYVRWGPLWRRRDEVLDLDVLRQALRALRDEYVTRRRMVLRLNPRLFAEDAEGYAGILANEGFSPLGYLDVERSLVMDLSPDLDALRVGLEKKWRNCLSKAERGNLTIVSGNSLELFEEFGNLYNQMLRRKQFVPTADLQAHQRLQTALTGNLKMSILVARKADQACAGVIYSAMGDTAVFLFGATNDEGMRNSASYLLQWETVKQLKLRAFKFYDLHGINPVTNHGTYHFKKGLAGKNGREVTFIGQLQVLGSFSGSHVLVAAERLRHRIRSVRRSGFKKLGPASVPP